MKRGWLRSAVIAIGLAGCAGFNRSCSSCNAESFGADWLVAQYRYDGTVMKCWRLENTSIANEEGSDGVYWKTPLGHLVHISGWYNRVQVEAKGWADAAAALGVDLDGCK